VSYIRLVSENTLQEMLSNPNEFVSEVGTVVCFGWWKCRIRFRFCEV